MRPLIHLLLCHFSALTLALLEQKFVSFHHTAGSVALHNATIGYAADDPIGVRIAVSSLADDLEQIIGRRPFTIAIGEWTSSLSHTLGGNAILVGTVNSKLIGKLVHEKGLDVADLDGKWESFKTSVVKSPFPGVEKALVIAGSDKRAAMYGLYTLAEQCGQSPFHWWADVPAEKHDMIFAPDQTTTFGEPSVKYRGMFINDEAPALTGWWSKTHGVDHKPLDTEFYRHVFDMMMRLRANFLWPAAWKSFVPVPGNVFFTDDPGNMQLADDYGIVISTSHHEPMQRATNEWYAANKGPWDWRNNKANVVEFMKEGVRRAGSNESYFTLGMRGPSDGPIQGDDPVAILEDVFETQRQLISDQYGNASAVNQLWTIYKEVATYYAAGLTPPDDVTLMFPDDNWGNVQRLPIDDEADRPGGIGLYFHLEYLGIPKGYKWQNTNNLPKVYKELFQAHQRGADRIWVINVGDIKPLELPFNMIMEMAWNISSIDFKTIPHFLEAFAAREFGTDHAEEIASIIMEHSRLMGRRKFESTLPNTYSVLHYHENERALQEWRHLARRILDVRETLAESRRYAFWHHVQYPAVAGYIYHAVNLGLGRNQEIGFQRRNSANDLAREVLEHFDRDYDLLEEYDAMLDGKWAGMLAQPHFDLYSQTAPEEWKEPTKDIISGLWYVQLRQNSTYAFGNLGIYAENSDSAHLQGRSLPSADMSAPTLGPFSPTLPLMDPYGKGTWTVELFHRGDYRIPIQWKLEIPFDWIHITPSSGQVSREHPEQKLEVTIEWDAVPQGFHAQVDVRITFDTLPWFDLIRLPIVNWEAPQDFIGFPETSGMISIEGPHFQRRSIGSVRHEHIPYLGTRTNSGSLALRPYKEARRSAELARGAWVEYDIFLFEDSRPLDATIYVNSALDTDPTLLMQYSLTLDGHTAPESWTRLLGDPARPGDTPPGWQTTVADCVWTRHVSFGDVPAGKHTLRWQTNSPEVYLEKIVLNTRGGVKSSYLGPPETRLLRPTKAEPMWNSEQSQQKVLH